MNGWDEQPDLADTAIGKLQQAIPYFLMVQVSIFLPYFSFFNPDARMVCDVIVFAGIAFFQDFINRFAAIAAKWLFIKDHRVVVTTFSAMVAVYFNIFVQLSNCPTVQLFDLPDLLHPEMIKIR